ncbi:hypothetical protein [Treponema socranskii]|uniref:hypothetical protein n=1 Tax=Treponema socranskii TaxID=53419 RepID=UPI0012DCD885
MKCFRNLLKQGSRFSDFERAADFNFRITLKSVKDYLRSSRPAAVNLSWALERMNTVCVEHKSEPDKEYTGSAFERR